MALAQGGLALTLGALAHVLGGGVQAAPNGAAMTWMSRLSQALAPSSASRSAVSIAMLGLVLVLARGSAGVLLAAIETKAAARRGTAARLRWLALALARPGSAATGIGGAVTWPAEVEIAARAERARVRAVLHLIVLAAVTIAIDATLAAVVLATLAPFALLLRPIRRALKRAHEATSAGAIELIDATRDVVEHAAVWATCGGGATAYRRVEALSREASALTSRAAAGQAFASASNEALAAIAILVLVAAFAPGRTTLIPVLVALTSAYRPLRDLAESSIAIARGARANEALASIGDDANLEEGSRAWPSGPLSARALAVDVGGERARSGVDFVAAAGSPVVIVGPPGSGKSALLEAMAGVRPSRGTLRHAGASIGAGIGPRHRPIAWMNAAPPVLPGTLAENLAPDAPTDRARIERARSILRALGDEAIGALPDDASLGPRGRKLSSGEAQRLALARALATELPVLLLDEPTANLDDQGERRAIEVLREAARDRALVLVTHRAGPRALAETLIELGEDAVGAAESERRIA
jgi:ABC-type transport system involved in cytochrome bd biosynthesis fused ATPase/permease subunit